MTEAAKKEVKKTIYELKLHESTSLPDGTYIMRVPGGWRYDCWDSQAESSRPGLFVPYDEEFK